MNTECTRTFRMIVDDSTLNGMIAAGKSTPNDATAAAVAVEADH